MFGPVEFIHRTPPKYKGQVFPKSHLYVLPVIEKVEDLNLLTLGTHPLKNSRKGEWGMTVTKNWKDYLGEALRKLPGPVQTIRDASPKARHPSRSSASVGDGQRSGRRSRLHGADDGAVLVAPHQSRQPAPVQARQRTLQAHHVGHRRPQAPLRQPAAPITGLGVHRK